MNWVDGPPTQPGVYVIEWGNAGGLVVCVIFKEGQELHYYTAKWAIPEKQHKLCNLYIKRHFPIPPTPNDGMNCDIYDDSFDPFTGRFADPRA